MTIINLAFPKTFYRAMIATAMLASASSYAVEWNGSLEDMLESQPSLFGNVMRDPVKFRVQIVYTQIDRDENNKPDFTTFTFRNDASEYFYPASTVKLPTAALALEKLNQLDVTGLDRNTAMLTGKSADYQSEAKSDPDSPDGLPNVANYVRKILLVSDNDAFNRLYEFVGQQALNERLHNMGFDGTRIVHRLEIGLSKDQNRLTNPIDFQLAGDSVFQQESKFARSNFYATEPQLLGVAEIVDGERINRPKDFSEKNAYPLLDQHNVVKSLIFPEHVPATQRFELSLDDYQFIRRYMSMYPGESNIAAYQDTDKYPPGYVKFLMYGGNADSIPANIRIFNKVGDAYGFLTDSAYIVDYKNKIEFLLSATIFSNENLTFNDDNYEYDEIGLPFLKNLGDVIYNIELERPRQFAPDLTELRHIKY